MQNIKRLSIDSLITDPWALMKGKKRYFWLLFLPTLLIAGYGVIRFSNFLLAFSLSIKSFHDLKHFNFIGNLGDLSTPAAIGIGAIAAFVFLYTYFGGFVLGCDVAKGVPFSRERLFYIFKRMWPGVVALLIVELIKMAFLFLPIVGWFLNLFLDPFFVLYIITTVYHRGPCKSFVRAWQAMKGNFWRMLVGYYVVVVITALLCMTLIGAIWGIPFMMIAFGIMNRELVEK